jgi:hypothetical protein
MQLGLVTRHKNAEFNFISSYNEKFTLLRKRVYKVFTSPNMQTANHAQSPNSKRVPRPGCSLTLSKIKHAKHRHMST